MSWEQLYEDVHSAHRAYIGDYELIVSTIQRSLVSITVQWTVRLEGSLLANERMPEIYGPSKMAAAIEEAKEAAERYVKSRRSKS